MLDSGPQAYLYYDSRPDSDLVPCLCHSWSCLAISESIFGCCQFWLPDGGESQAAMSLGQVSSAKSCLCRLSVWNLINWQVTTRPFSEPDLGSATDPAFIRKFFVAVMGLKLDVFFTVYLRIASLPSESLPMFPPASALLISVSDPTLPSIPPLLTDPFSYASDS